MVVRFALTWRLLVVFMLATLVGAACAAPAAPQPAMSPVSAPQSASGPAPDVQPAASPTTASEPTSRPAVTAAGTTTPLPQATPLAASAELALVWEGPALGGAEPGKDDCGSLRVAADGQATVGRCGPDQTSSVKVTIRSGLWAEMLARFAPFEYRTATETLIFKGRGQVSDPAWQRAVATWARFTYAELRTGHAAAAGRTSMSWFLREIPGQPGDCEHLVVLNFGYAYSNVDRCEGSSQTRQSIGGWLETAEWQEMDGWITGRAPVMQANNYLNGEGAQQMTEAEIARLSKWAQAVYSRLSSQAGPAAPSPAPTRS